MIACSFSQSIPIRIIRSGNNISDSMKIDFHVHTHHSPDSIIKPKELLEKAKKLSIIPAITNHNTLAAHSEFKKLQKKLNFDFIPGEEIRTREGDLIALYIQEVIPKFTPFLEAVDKIKEQGGISIVPHMYDTTRHVVNDPKLASKADGIEVFNARCPLRSQNERALVFAKKYKKLHSAGSDSHFLFEFGHTYLEVPDFDMDNPKDLLHALKKSKIHGKKSPFFVRGTTRIVKFLKGISR